VEETSVRALPIPPPWLRALTERIERMQRDGTANLLDDCSHTWASRIVAVFSDDAGRQLILDYVIYATSRHGDKEAGRRKRVLIRTTSDASLTSRQRVRHLIAKICGELDDLAYLKGLDRRICRWEHDHPDRGAQPPAQAGPAADRSG